MSYVSVTGPMTETLTGVIVSKKGEYVTFRSKKPRSSKFLETIVHQSDILALYGNVGEEGAQLTRKTVGEITGVEGVVSFDKDGNLVCTAEGDSPMTFYASEGFSISAVEQVDGPAAE